MADKSSFAINTFSYMESWRALDCLRHLAGQGYTSFELMTYPNHFWFSDTDNAERIAIRQYCEANGLRIVAINVPNIDTNIAGASPEARAYTLRLFEDLIRLGSEVGSESIILGTGRPNALLPLSLTKVRDHLRRGLDRLFPVATALNMSILIENVPFCFMPDVHAILDMLDNYGNPDIGVICDLANAHFIGEDISSALRAGKSRLKMVHLSDTTRKTFKHDPVGHGDVPFAVASAVLKEISYRGPRVLELISKDPDIAIANSIRLLGGQGF